ncbi:unnamed protein product [Prorocentrum cordatum]|uniref:Chlorophyll a-b binding protein, chloroplastic n=1 Tax=Prorocentrum cordatum TaxID=2364126 RepID=A0ABN9VBB3_9DINO|nr:unnamed protein product [Polarella glacialis]
MFFQGGLAGSAWGDWATYTESPLRAFESESDLQAPVGYWDPLGLAKDSGADVLYRRRCTEIKHSRVARCVAIGCIVPDCFLWPGGVAPVKGDGAEDLQKNKRSLTRSWPKAAWPRWPSSGCSSRTTSRAPPGATGRPTRIRSCAPSRARWARRRPSATGTRSALRKAAMRMSSSGGGALRSSAAASPCGPPGSRRT